MTEKQIYTEEIHIKNLVDILNNKPLCDCCPAAENYSQSKSWADPWSNKPCDICLEFIGHPNKTPYCPCIIYGNEEALAKTLLKLEEKGIEVNSSNEKGG